MSQLESRARREEACPDAKSRTVFAVDQVDVSSKKFDEHAGEEVCVPVGQEGRHRRTRTRSQFDRWPWAATRQLKDHRADVDG